MMWKKKLQTIALTLAVAAGSGLLISSYVNLQYSPLPPNVNTITNNPGDLILRDDDDIQPGKVAKVVVDVQEVAEVGELVRFDLTKSIAQSFKWILVPDAVDFEIYDGGQRAVFSARKPGDYMFIIGCGYEGTVDIAIHIVTVEGPIDPIDPDNYPIIPRPDVNAGIDQWTSHWCSINKRPKDEAEKLAGSFEGVAAQIAAGVLQKADDIIKATSNANRMALGNSLSEWVPVLQELQTTMKTLAGQGKLSTPDQHQALWGEIAKGLRYYESVFN